MLTKELITYISVYDVLTGNIVKSSRGHTDIVRDVAWHPVRNEILTSSWDKHVNINTYNCPNRVPFKRLIRPDETNEDGGDGSSAPPPRRSRRIALKRHNQNSEV